MRGDELLAADDARLAATAVHLQLELEPTFFPGSGAIVAHRRARGLDGALEHTRDGGVQPGELLERQRSEEHTSELQSRLHLVCRLLLEKKKTLPDLVRLEGRVLFLGEGATLVPSQLAGADFDWTHAIALRDNTQTDEITPAFCRYYYDE